MRRNTPSMMIDVDEKELQTKQGGAKAFIKTTTEAKRLRSSNVRNPRIVRAPRSFGRKDRHSKVSTVRGLRDRRVRLSVPTAIQVYNLQDTLGLNQPSKVIDWLLNAAKHAIDELPPLQFPPESLINLYGVSALNSPQAGRAHQASTSSSASVRLEEVAQKHCIDENIVFGGGMQDSFMAPENISSVFASNASFAMDFDGKQEYNHALQLKSSSRASYFGVPNNMSFLHPNLAFTIREANHNPN